jgi:hypothetical protein
VELINIQALKSPLQRQPRTEPGGESRSGGKKRFFLFPPVSNGAQRRNHLFFMMENVHRVDPSFIKKTTDIVSFPLSKSKMCHLPELTNKH